MNSTYLRSGSGHDHPRPRGAACAGHPPRPRAGMDFLSDPASIAGRSSTLLLFPGFFALAGGAGAASTSVFNRTLGTDARHEVQRRKCTAHVATKRTSVLAQGNRHTIATRHREQVCGGAVPGIGGVGRLVDGARRGGAHARRIDNRTTPRIFAPQEGTGTTMPQSFGLSTRLRDFTDELHDEWRAATRDRHVCHIEVARITGYIERLTVKAAHLDDTVRISTTGLKTGYHGEHIGKRVNEQRRLHATVTDLDEYRTHKNARRDDTPPDAA